MCDCREYDTRPPPLCRTLLPQRMGRLPFFCSADELTKQRPNPASSLHFYRPQRGSPGQEGDACHGWIYRPCYHAEFPNRGGLDERRSRYRSDAIRTFCQGFFQNARSTMREKLRFAPRQTGQFGCAHDVAFRSFRCRQSTPNNSRDQVEVAVHSCLHTSKTLFQMTSA